MVAYLSWPAFLGTSRFRHRAEITLRHFLAGLATGSWLFWEQTSLKETLAFVTVISAKLRMEWDIP